MLVLQVAVACFSVGVFVLLVVAGSALTAGKTSVDDCFAPKWQGVYLPSFRFVFSVAVLFVLTTTHCWKPKLLEGKNQEPTETNLDPN